MKKMICIFYPLMLLTLSCGNILYPKYGLEKKYPNDVQDCYIEFRSDTTGIIAFWNSEKVITSFDFSKIGKNFIVIKSVDSDAGILPISKGDTLVYFKKELYLFTDKQKLIFDKVD